VLSSHFIAGETLSESLVLTHEADCILSPQNRNDAKPFAVSGGLSRFGAAILFFLKLLPTGTCWKPHPVEPYSYRSATTGSTRIARRAGGYDASRATTRNDIERNTK
jgi:hypothetical protein